LIRVVDTERAGDTVLLIEDDDSIREFVKSRLEQAGFGVVEVSTGIAGLQAFAAHDIDVVVVDVGLPDIDGFSVVRAIRERSLVPIMMMTAAVDEIDRVMGLEIGADDYVTKPFLPREMVARVRALVRRSHQQEPPPSTDLQDAVGGIVIDALAREARVDGIRLDLKAREFDLLAFLAASPRQVFTRDQLLRQVWQVEPGWISDATVTEHVRRVRLELVRHEGCTATIATVRGTGYRFELDA
jgi:DNA-binding response OmpR family regulator